MCLAKPKSRRGEEFEWFCQGCLLGGQYGRTMMEPVDVDQERTALEGQGLLLGHHHSKLESVLRCLRCQDLSSWSLQYSMNSLPASATGLLPFLCFLCYQHPLFLTLEENSVPSLSPQHRHSFNAANSGNNPAWPCSILRAETVSLSFGVALKLPATSKDKSGSPHGTYPLK